MGCANLPLELLEAIFDLCQQGTTRYNAKQILTSSQVCRSWREASLLFRHLWRFVDLTYGDLALEFLKRSHPVPVHLTIYTPWHPVYENTLIKLQNLSPEVHAFEASVPSSATADRVLHLISQHHFPSFTFAVQSQFPTSILIDASSIRHLDLRNCSVDWYQCQDLTCFRLGSITSNYAPSSRELVNILNRSQRIEVLDFTDITMDPWSSYIPVIHLPNLKLLRLLNTGEDDLISISLNYVMSLVSIPTTTKVVIESALCNLRGFTPRVQDPWMLQIDQSHSLWLSTTSLQAYMDHSTSSCRSQIQEPVLSITVPNTLPVKLIEQYGAEFGVQKVGQLNVFGSWKGHKMPPREWLSLFRAFGNLVTICVQPDDTDVELFTNILTDFNDWSLSIEKTSYSQLRTLTFVIPKAFPGSDTDNLIRLAQISLDSRVKQGSQTVSIRIEVNGQSNCFERIEA